MLSAVMKRSRDITDVVALDDKQLSPGAVTELLLEWRRGEATALPQLIELVYEQLQRIAARHLVRESEQRLDPSELVHEAYERLVREKEMSLENRAHFFGIAAKVMRRILVDDARKRYADKRGAGAVHLPLDAEQASYASSDVDVPDLDRALAKLERREPRQARIVELRFFGGLSVEECADVLDTSPRTVKREWQRAREALAGLLSP